MTANDPQPIADQVTLSGDDAAVYESLVTLEFVGHETTLKEIATAMKREAGTVLKALEALTDRGMVVRTERAGEPAYEPSWRGWSTAPEQATGPQL